MGLDRIQQTLEFFELDLPPSLIHALKWVERHPRAVLAGALVLGTALLLAQTPPDTSSDRGGSADEAPLFI